MPLADFHRFGFPKSQISVDCGLRASVLVLLVPQYGSGYRPILATGRGHRARSLEFCFFCSSFLRYQSGSLDWVAVCLPSKNFGLPGLELQLLSWLVGVARPLVP